MLFLVDTIFDFDGLRYTNEDRVYPVEMDTLALLRSFKEVLEPGMNVIDMGCGAGLLSIYGITSGCRVVSVDREPRALELTRKNLALNGLKGTLYISDLFQGVPASYRKWADLITLNPPYLSHDNGEIDLRADLSLIGGQNGYELSSRFLGECKDFLKDRGKVLLLRYPHWSIDILSPDGTFRLSEVKNKIDMNGETLEAVTLELPP